MGDTNDKQALENVLVKKRRCEEMTTGHLANHQKQPHKKQKIDMQQEKSFVDDMGDKSTQLTVQKLQQQIEELENNRQLLLNKLAEVKSHNGRIQKKNDVEPSLQQAQEKGNELEKIRSQEMTTGDLASHQEQPQNSQGDQTSTEVNQILIQLEQLISKTAALEDNLEEQDKSTKLIIEELGQQIAELEEANGLFLSELDAKERAYLEEMDDLQEKVNDLYINITCSMCKSPWKSDGEHRLVSLYCGHLFGKNCIQRLAACPTCGLTIRSTGMRPIFGRNVLPAH